MPKANKSKRVAESHLASNDSVSISEEEDHTANAEIARSIQALRAAAGLTQKELADRIGTTASAICRLEDARYEGHSVAMLRRIAAALNKSLEIRFLPSSPSS